MTCEHLSGKTPLNTAHQAQHSSLELSAQAYILNASPVGTACPHRYTDVRAQNLHIRRLEVDQQDRPMVKTRQ